MADEEYNTEIQTDTKDKKKSTKIIARKAGKIAGALAVVFLFVVIIQQLNMMNDPDYLPSMFGYTYLNVLSPSMEPELSTNDLMVGKLIDSAEGLEVGDIITYLNGGMLVTHRIVRVNEDGSFVTQGDANNVEDSVDVTESMLIADYSFRIPFAGYIIAKLQDPIFLLILWVIAMYCIIREIIKEVKNKKQKQKPSEPVEQQPEESEESKNSL